MAAREQLHNAVDLYEKLFDNHESTTMGFHNLAANVILQLEATPKLLSVLSRLQPWDLRF